MSYQPDRIGYFHVFRRRIHVVLCGLAVGVVASSVAFTANTQPAKTAGVVVEKLISVSVIPNPGFHAGDVITSWTRGDAHGVIDSPFDLERTEVNEAPQGATVFRGKHELKDAEWSLPPGGWRLQVHPVLNTSASLLYEQAQKLIAQKNPAQAAQAWRAAASASDAPSNSRLTAWILLNAARSLSGGVKGELAGTFFSDALHSALNDPVATAQIQRDFGQFRAELRDWKGADVHLKEALAADKEVGPASLSVARDLSYLGDASYGLADLDAAEKYFSSAIEIQKRLAPQDTFCADSLTGLGNVAQRRDNLDAAEKLHQDAIAIRKKAGQQGYPLARNFAGLGNIEYTRGDLEKSESWFHQAYELNIGPDGKEIYAAANLNNLGLVAEQKGDYLEAEKYLREALSIKEKLAPGSLDVGSTLHNLSVLSRERGDLESSNYFLRRALSIFETKAPESWYVATALHSLTLGQVMQGDLDSAAANARRTLAIRRRVVPDSLEVSGSLNDLGNIALERGELLIAEKYLHEALELEQKIAPDRLDVAETLISLGDLARKRATLTEAEGFYRQALVIRQKNAPGSLIHAESLADLAGVLRREQRSGEALSFYEKALDALENQTARLGGSETVRSTYRAHHADYYKDYVDLLLEQKKPELAFQVLERFRARALLETLSSAHVDIRKGVAPELLERERLLHRAIQRGSDSRVRLVAETHTDEQLRSVDVKINDLLMQLRRVEGEIRAVSPSYSALLQPRQITSSDVQQQVLDDDTVLLEYELGQERSHLFLVTSNSLEVYDLPDRASVEAIARRVYGLLNKPARPSVHPDHRTGRSGSEDATFLQEASELSRVLLGPVAGRLAAKRLLIVSDGALAYVPFAMLPEPGGLGSSRYQPLVLKYEIVNLPSASVLAVLRQQESNRQHPQKAVFVMADPVFASSDPRVLGKNEIPHPLDTGRGQGRLQANTAKDSLDLSASDVGATRNGRLALPRLKYTRREAEAILSVSPPRRSMQALDFRASRATALSHEMAQYRIVHFATHGFLDSKHPELSGLVLSLVDQRGRPQIGFLDLEDIYNLNLPVDLVVLSACETGLGKEINGEGLIGLTRGFMHAGATRVVASLWNVSDEATAKLMAEFYRSMEQDNVPPAAALRRAQINMISMKRWSAPYYWAAFQIQGEWK